jgi:hypothetical protein
MEAAMDDKTRTELEATAFRTLVDHLRTRTDVQNIDLMNLAGFCRNCLSKWYRAAAEERGLPMTEPEAREIVYGMPFPEWKAKYQKDASPDQQAKFKDAAKQAH